MTAPAKPDAWRSRIVGTGEEKPDQLLANPRNWRIHPKAQQDALAGVLTEVGWVQNVIVNRTTGYVIDGHARVAIAISREEESVPVVYVELTEEEEKIIIASLDPLAAMAGTDQAKLDELLAEISVKDDALRAMLGTPSTDGLTDPDAVLEEPEPRAQAGDLWALGDHRLLCGDATDPGAVGRLLAGVVPRLMVTDPPYGVDYHPEWRESVAAARGVVANHKVAKPANDDRCDWREAWGLFPGEVAYSWHASLHTADVAESIIASGFDVRNQIIWNKQIITFSRGDYHWQHEPCWYAVRQGGTSEWAGDRKQSTVWNIATLHVHGGGPEAGEQTQHSTQKPIECMQRPIHNHQATEVYDPFIGSGTTIIAAEREGRRAYAMEIEPRYVDMAIQRWEDYTGQTAVKEKA